ncbi:hypothetical protein EYF80_045638 [Liparis tanakae]|uniref:Uncharacterized protein n=1 Tax=Liparis tanakae TaxID=230148 RepID=A0A4Z2FSM3_9TELE|nr:hypothetical protein EYF80_045638 [Liparis tanakae]
MERRPHAAVIHKGVTLRNRDAPSNLIRRALPWLWYGSEKKRTTGERIKREDDGELDRRQRDTERTRMTKSRGLRREEGDGGVVDDRKREKGRQEVWLIHCEGECSVAGLLQHVIEIHLRTESRPQVSHEEEPPCRVSPDKGEAQTAGRPVPFRKKKKSAIFVQRFINFSRPKSVCE